MNGLTKSQIMMVVNRYIGVFDGYLADFSYRSHSDFYPEYCGLDLDPDVLEGTTRERFIQILSNAEPMDQAKILQGVLARFPLEADPRPLTRTEEVRTDIEVMISAISGGPRIASPALATRIEIVERALQDAELLIAQQGATSAVDRVHTALHAYLVGLCDSIGVEASADASMTSLFKTLRQQHPALKPTGPRSDDIDKILRAFSSVLDSMNPLRNQASLAHPQTALLEQPEALVVVHAARTVLHYLDARCRLVAEDTVGRFAP